MKKKTSLPASELELMLLIWELGSNVSTTQIMQKLKTDKSVQLVQSYLKRLEEKKFIEVKKLGRLNYYNPLISLEEYRNQETTSLLGSFYQKSPSKLFASLVNNNKITSDELEEIRKILKVDE